MILISIAFIIFLILAIIVLIIDPTISICIFRLTKFKFKIVKKEGSNYYLKIRIFYIWYYINEYRDYYYLYLYPDKKSINYSPAQILSNKNIIYEKRWDIVKYYSDTSSPEDNLEL